jgi:4-carboxymuconolactone decarboxylase
MSATPTFGRYAEIPVDQMTAEQQDGYRFLVEGPRGRLPGPYKVWVHNPKLLRAAAPLGQHFTPGQSSLTEREREIAVIVITSKWRSAYPTAAHEQRGKEVGRRPRSRTFESRSSTRWRRRWPTVGWFPGASMTARSRRSGTRA